MVRGKNNKKGKQKKPMVFAKDRNQAILGITVFSVFIIYTIYNVSNYFYQQHQMDVKAAMAIKQSAEKNGTDASNVDIQGGTQEVAQSAPQGVPQDVAQDANNIYSQTLELQGNKSPNENPALKQGGANSNNLPPFPDNSKVVKRVYKGKMMLVSVEESGRSNPFLPAAENYSPSSLPAFNLTAPPETLAVGSDADNVMGTKISGILYDKYSPSAIINIGGTDYLVKIGDVINRYRILTIGKEQVIVQLGKNIYKAGVGQLLTQSSINYNTIANLNKKFGGNGVSIGVKKRK